MQEQTRSYPLRTGRSGLVRSFQSCFRCDAWRTERQRTSANRQVGVSTYGSRAASRSSPAQCRADRVPGARIGLRCDPGASRTHPVLTTPASCEQSLRHPHTDPLPAHTRYAGLPRAGTFIRRCKSSPRWFARTRPSHRITGSNGCARAA